MKCGLKTLVLSLASASVFSAEAKDGCAYSSNIHGIVKVESQSTNVLIAVPWSFYTPDGSSTADMPIDHLVKPDALDDGDMLLSVTETHPQKYEAWMLLKDAESGVGKWEPAITVSDGATALLAETGLVSQFRAKADAAIARGFGLWLIRTNPKGDNGQWKPFYLYGQRATNDVTVTVGGMVGADPNAIMIAYPFCSQAFNVNGGDVPWANLGVNEQDTLSLPNGSDAWDLALWDSDRKEWYVSKTVRTSSGRETQRIYNLTVPAGHGFWYVRRAPSPITITFRAK